MIACPVIERVVGAGGWGAKPEWFSLPLPAVPVKLDIWRIDRYPKTGHWVCHFEVLAGWARFPASMGSISEPKVSLSLDSIFAIQDWLRANPPQQIGVLEPGISLPLKLNFDQHTVYLHLGHASVGRMLRVDGNRLGTSKMPKRIHPPGDSMVFDRPEAERQLRRLLKQHSREILDSLATLQIPQ